MHVPHPFADGDVMLKICWGPLQLLHLIAMYILFVYTSGMTQSTVFKNNKTQAVRIPKALAFADNVKKVKILQQGNGLFIVPMVSAGSWAEFFESPGIGDDFMSDREQPLPQRRKF
jgi:antitoxin VapB